MKYDFHVHTEFSSDSKAKMSNYVNEAKTKQIGAICFTDHVDFNLNDLGYNVYNPKEFFRELDKIKSEKSIPIQIYGGIEFSEPHQYQKQMAELTKYPYDFILGSIHWVGDLFPCEEVRQEYSAEIFYEMYWKEVLAAVEIGGFDCLGHIDFPKRYYKQLIYDQDILKQIFSNMVNNQIVLEINTSSIRKGIATSMPDEELLRIYMECGGQYVTIGSDAHVEQDLAADFDYAEMLIQRLGLTKVYFEKRKMIVCPV